MSIKEEKVLNGTTWKMEDVNELERELLINIERLNGDEKDLRRIANTVSSNFGKIRSLIHAERYLEENMGVRFIREVKK
jgi:hypothetical protein